MKPNKTPRKHAAFASSSRQMKRRPKVKSLLAVLVAFCTVCALTMPAATLEGQAQASCGLAEHTHDESCYESVLVCGQEESEGHVHDESCYEEVLTCEIPEHTHSEACWAQPETQAEAGNEENSEAVTEDGAGSDMEAAAGTETGTDTEADTGTGTGTDSSENGDAAEAGSETDSSGNAGTGAGDNGSAESGAESGDGQTGNGGAGSEADGTAENGSGTENAGEQGESTSAEDALTEADKTEQAENPQAAEEAAEMPDGATVPEGYTEQYTVRDEENGFAVTVYAPEGVVPEGAVLSAELLSEETEEYAVAEQELAAETEAVMAENGVSALSEDGADAASEDGEAAAPSYGFAALDIHFEYENGEEVEPNGDVYVVIDAAGLLPEDADPESVTVQHHAEQEDGSVTVETVADTAEETAGVVAVVENEAQAENDVQAAFEVDGFSTFTITWGKYYNGGKDVTLDITYWDTTNEQSLDGPQDPSGLDLNLTSKEEFNFDSEKMPEIDGYVFDHAEYEKRSWGEESQWIQITGVRATQQKLDIPFMGTQYWWTWEVQSSNNWQTLNSEPSIRLCYVEDNGGENPGGGDNPSASATVTTSKSAVLDEDTGNYTLNLSVSGDRGSVSEKQAVDVLFILDESNSMRDGWGNTTRWRAARSAIAQIIGLNENNGLSDNTSLDVQYSLVSFYGGNSTRRNPYNDALVREDWTSSETELYNAIPQSLRERDYGGTNYEAGFLTGNNQLDKARSGALKVVIFISDGNPGYYYNNSGETKGTGDPGNSYNSTALSHAVSECKKMDTDYFYFVGVTNDVSGDVFDDIVEAVDVLLSNKGKYSSDNSDDLMEAFEKIQEKITFFAANNVTMTDPLSDYADLVATGADGTYEFTLKLEKRADVNADYTQVDEEKISVNAGSTGTAVTLQDGNENVSMTVFVERDEATGKETIRVEFTDNYQLAQNYRYTVSTKITPSQYANERFAERGESAYEGMTGETGTGTHQNTNGFWSNINEEAIVSFDSIVTDEDGNVTSTTPGTEDFPDPVIQVQKPATGELTITKAVEGVDADAVSEQSFEFKIIASDNVTGELPDIFGDDREATVTITGTGTTTISDLPVGTYTVQEVLPADLPDYQFDSVSYEIDGQDVESVPVTVNVEAGNMLQIKAINAYTRITDITIKKVDSSNKTTPLEGAEFLLYYKTDDRTLYYSNLSGTVSWVEQKEDATTLRSDTSGFVRIEGLRMDTIYYLVETKAPDGYNLLEHEVKISWDSEGELQAFYGATPIEDIDQTKRIITVTNSTGTELPETGGPGTTILTIGGLLLMAGAVGGGYGLRRRRGKEGR